MKSMEFFFCFSFFFVIPAQAVINSSSCHSSGKFETRRAPLDSRLRGNDTGGSPQAILQTAAV